MRIGLSSSHVPEFLEEFVGPWYASLRDPAQHQGRVAEALLEGYRKTDYGSACDAEHAEGLAGLRSSFPIVDYPGLEPYFRSVMAGNYSSLLPEPVVRWVMTRGTTGVPKMIPCTRTHLSQILLTGARAIVNFAVKRDPRVLERKVLNLNFPSEVGELSHGERYGYSSGTYARLHPELGPASLVPRQDKIDSLGGGVRKSDWERRFELVLEEARGEDIGSVIGVTPVMTAFSAYLRGRHGLLPRQVWEMDALFCTSVAKIQTRYAPLLARQYGRVPIVEMYAATEGVFAQQLDELPYVSPNYDVCLFEARTSRGIRLLHELRPREWGRLIVSTALFPRYDMGDLIEAMGKGYFRILGRAGRATVMEHLIFNLVTGRL